LDFFLFLLFGSLIDCFFVNIIIFTSHPLSKKKKESFFFGIINEFVISVSFCAGVFILFPQLPFTYQVDPVLSLSLSLSLSFSLSLFLSFSLSLTLPFLSFSLDSYSLSRAFFSRSLLFTQLSWNQLDNVSRRLRFGVLFFNCIIGIALTCR